MSEAPKRRRFQYRISTVLIVTAIFAWGMALRPSFTSGIHPLATGRAWGSGLSFVVDEFPTGLSLDGPKGKFDNITFQFTVVGSNGFIAWMMVGPTAIAWPCLALAAFVSWKAAERLIKRRRARRNLAATT